MPVAQKMRISGKDYMGHLDFTTKRGYPARMHLFLGKISGRTGDIKLHKDISEFRYIPLDRLHYSHIAPTIKAFIPAIQDHQNKNI